MGHGVGGKKRRVAVIFYTLLVGLVLMAPPGASGRPAPPTDQFLSRNMTMKSDRSSTWMMAERLESSPPEEASGSGKEKSTAEGQSDNPSEKTPDRPKSEKSFKPFKPTERISADQAVDFPSDI
jgi:hypothetical protein